MELFDHPGLLFYGGLIEILHADWPSYPPGHGWEPALKALAVFPGTVRFVQISDIDKCRLFIVRGLEHEPRGDKFDPSWFHVAIWQEDLLELHRRGMIDGISLVSAYEEAVEYHEQHRDLFVETPSGMAPLQLPPPHAEDFEDEPPSLKVSDVGLQIAPAGTTELERLAPPIEELHARIRSRVIPLLEIHFHDTAVREAAVILETRLREITASTLYGHRLVEAYLQLLYSYSGDRATAFVKVLRGELRAVFKFVRNEFAHALRDLTAPQCLVLLSRVSAVLEAVEDIEQSRGRE